MARINLYLLHPHSLKLVHFLPACFVIGCLLCLLGGIFFSWYCLLPLLLLIFVFFIDSWRLNKSIKVAFLSIVASFIQLFAYGIGFIHAVFAALILKRPVKGMFVRNFYKWRKLPAWLYWFSGTKFRRSEICKISPARVFGAHESGL